jgi:hypothetical protein
MKKILLFLYFVPGIVFLILGWQFVAGLAFGIPLSLRWGNLYDEKA